MSATTPLMSEYPADVKAPVESVLPVYHLNNDAEELTVGGRRRCFWRRFCHRRSACAANAEGQKKKGGCLKRAIRRFFTIFLVLGVASFFFAKHKGHCVLKHHPVVCVPLESTGPGEVTLPLAHLYTHVGIHNSLNGDDIHITHSDDVEEGTVSIKFDLPTDVKLNDDEDVPEYYVCHIAGPKFVGVGIHPKDKKADRIKATSTTITLSSKEAGHSRAINILGPHPKFHHRHGHFFQRLHRKFSIRHKIHKAIRKAVREAAKLAALCKMKQVDAE